MQCGPVSHRIKQKDLSAHISASWIFPRVTDFEHAWNDDIKIQDVSSRMIEDIERNELIVRDVDRIIGGRKVPVDSDGKTGTFGDFGEVAGKQG